MLPFIVDPFIIEPLSIELFIARPFALFNVELGVLGTEGMAGLEESKKDHSNNIWCY